MPTPLVTLTFRISSSNGLHEVKAHWYHVPRVGDSIDLARIGSLRPVEEGTMNRFRKVIGILWFIPEGGSPNDPEAIVSLEGDR